MMDDDGMSMAMMAQGHASLAIAIAGLADSGQDGVAILVDKGDQTEVVLNIASGAADVPQPADIHTGTCDALGGVNHSLAHVVNGISLTMVDANLASLLTGDFAINVHHSGDDIGTYVACGNVPAGASQATVALSAMNDSGQDGTATLIDMGADTTVVVSVAQGEGDAPQPIHIHAGTCEDLGGVEHALTTAASGFSVTTVAESMSNLLGGGLAINLHKSGSETSVYVACGNLASGEAKVDDGIMSSSGVLASAIAQFSRENLTISVGDTVSWTNQDNAPHTVSAGVSPNVDSPPQFRSATMARNGTFTHTFTTAGTFAYFCEIHPSMIAQVTVK
jgi:plastocyanin